MAAAKSVSSAVEAGRSSDGRAGDGRVGVYGKSEVLYLGAVRRFSAWNAAAISLRRTRSFQLVLSLNEREWSE
jgi:hypothetical protein